MKLFDDFEAVKFEQENLIFITHNSYIYYIYNFKYKHWRKHKHAGNDSITVCNYPDVSREELTEVMGGIFPTKETDFMRLCNSSELRIGDMLCLLNEDYQNYMNEPDTFFEIYPIYHTIHQFLLESDVCYKSYEKIREILDDAVSCNKTREQVLKEIIELSYTILGRDIYKEEIGIVDGHDGSSFFWIMPVRIIEMSNTNEIDNVAEMKSVEISIEEDDVAQYLTPFLYKYFDNELEANKKRIEYRRKDDNGKEQISYIADFEWYLTHNFYSFKSIENILKDIRDTIDALSTGRENEYIEILKEKRGTATNTLLYSQNMTDEQIKEYNDNRPKEDNTPYTLLIDFYQRFLYRMEYMIKVGKEKGYNLISFMGP